MDILTLVWSYTYRDYTYNTTSIVTIVNPNVVLESFCIHCLSNLNCVL